MPTHGSVPAQAGREPRGRPETGVHVPSVPESAHASHWPSQATSQHTPSAQNPDVHSVAVLHATPFPLFSQVPALQ